MADFNLLDAIRSGLGGLLPQQYAQQQQPQGPSFGERAGAGFQNFTQSDSPLSALGNLVSGLQTGARTDPLGRQNAAMTATYQSLVGAGVHPSVAAAATMNPEILKTIAPTYFDTQPKLQETGVDPLSGQKSFSVYNAQRQTLTPIGGGPGGGGQSSYLAEGNTAINHNLSGEDYLNQFSPEVKAAARAYMAGDVMPTGNSRNQNINTLAKTVAQKYAQDVGLPDVNDAKYAAKRKMQTDLASSGPSSMGGIISNGKSAFEHLATGSQKMVDLNNNNADWAPFGGAAVAHISNESKNTGGSSGQAGKVTAVTDALGKYGAESTKFYSATGGGEAERLGALRALKPTSSSGHEQASFLETERDLMLGRLRQKENQIRGEMGDAYLAAHPVMTPDLVKNLKTIDDNIAKLHGQTPATASAQVTPPTGFKQAPDGKFYSEKPGPNGKYQVWAP